MSKSTILTAAISATAGAAVGSLATYFAVRKSIQKKADAEIQQVREHYRLARQEDGSLRTVVNNFHNTVSPEVRDGYEKQYQNAVKNLTEEEYEEARQVAEKLKYTMESPVSAILREEDEGNQAVDSNIFDNAVDEKDILPSDDEEDEMDDYEAEPGKPFLISREEFEDGDSDFEPETLTYYELDDTLCDSRDKAIEDIDAAIGDKNLRYFGRQSGDPSIVYVRNPNIGADFEVIRNHGAYTSAVLGLSDEEVGLRPAKTRPMKMREHE